MRIASATVPIAPRILSLAFRKRDVNNLSVMFSIFLFLFLSLQQHTIPAVCFRFLPAFAAFAAPPPSSRSSLLFLRPTVLTIPRRLVSRSVALRARKSLSPSGLRAESAGVPAPPIADASSTGPSSLARLLCLRCAKYAAKNPTHRCSFDKESSKKCFCLDWPRSGPVPDRSLFWRP